jgi:hypothetical protein
VWTPLRRWPGEECENGVTYGGQGWLGRAADSFFSALLLRGGGGQRLRRAQAQEQSGEVFELHHRYRDDEDDVQDQMNVAVCP